MTFLLNLSLAEPRCPEVTGKVAGPYKVSHTQLFPGTRKPSVAKSGQMLASGQCLPDKMRHSTQESTKYTNSINNIPAYLVKHLLSPMIRCLLGN